MNPDRVWRELANDALANQIVTEHYDLFVAMPFRDQFSYRSDRVFSDVVEAAVAETRAAELTLPIREANSRGQADVERVRDHRRYRRGHLE
jgi:hypothetical protein